MDGTGLNGRRPALLDGGNCRELSLQAPSAAVQGLTARRRVSADSSLPGSACKARQCRPGAQPEVGRGVSAAGQPVGLYTRTSG